MLTAYICCGIAFVIYLICNIIFGDDDFYKEQDITTLLLGLFASFVIWPIGLGIDLYTWYQKNKI